MRYRSIRRQGRRSGVGFIDTVTGKSLCGEGEGRGARRLHARVGAPAAAVEIAAASERHRQLERRRRPLLLRAPDGPERHRPREGSRRRAAHARRWPAGRLLRAAIPQSRRQAEPSYIRGYGFEGGERRRNGAGRRAPTPGFGKAWKKHVRDYAGAYIDMGGFGEVLPRYENSVSIDPVVKDRWGIPVLRFDYSFGDNEKKMAADMAATAQEMFEAAGFEIVDVERELLTEGWSIHELGTSRMGSDPKTSALNQFQQSHDVKNLFVVDGSSHVNASCQNPTWTIMALAWRSCEYLADELKKGEL